jgi:hypothetical protein
MPSVGFGMELTLVLPVVLVSCGCDLRKLRNSSAVSRVEAGGRLAARRGRTSDNLDLDFGRALRFCDVEAAGVEVDVARVELAGRE